MGRSLLIWSRSYKGQGHFGQGQNDFLACDPSYRRFFYSEYEFDLENHVLLYKIKKNQMSLDVINIFLNSGKKNALCISDYMAEGV